MPSQSRKKGDIGEEVAVKYLERKGFFIVERNYWRPFGEIDIVALKDDCHRFIEVKTLYGGSVIHETFDIRPEENFHSDKRRRMWKVIQDYVITHSISNWEADLMAVVMHGEGNRKVKIRYIQDIVL